MSNLAEQIRKAEERLAKLREDERKLETKIEAEAIRWLKESEPEVWERARAKGARAVRAESKRRSNAAKRSYEAKQQKAQAQEARSHEATPAQAQAQSNGRQNVWVGHAQRPA